MSNKDKYRWQQGGNKIQILLTRQKKINMQKATVKSIKGTELTWLSEKYIWYKKRKSLLKKAGTFYRLTNCVWAVASMQENECLYQKILDPKLKSIKISHLALGY